MAWKKSSFILAATVAAFLSATGGPAVALPQSVVWEACDSDMSESRSCIKACARAEADDPDFNDYSNATSRLCRSINRAEELKSFKTGKKCSDTVCMFRLRETKGKDLLWKGQGFSLVIKLVDSGRSYFLKDPTGAQTEFYACGTCQGIEYSDGPLSGTEIVPAGADFVVAVLRSEFQPKR